MDRLEAGIIRELTSPGGSYPWNARQSYSKMARKFRVDEDTIRRRVRRMEELGLLRGTELVVNPYLIGREPVRLVLDVADSETKQKAISQMKLIDGVLLVVDWHGETLHVLLFCENERDVSRKTQLISSIAGCEHPQILRNLDALGFRRCDLKIARTDLMILKSLRKEPRKSPNQVASEIGVSARTVERRIANLTNASAFFHMIDIDFQKVDGVVSSAFVTYEDERRKSMLDSLIGSRLDRLLFSATGGTKTSQFTFVCRNVAETESLREWIRELDGVAQLRVGLVKKYILVSEWLDGKIENMLSDS